jgi:glycerophosphoryl diester phosphodiesterase
VAAITDYIAFDFDVCLKVKALSPKASIQYLSGDKSPEELWPHAGLDGFDYHFNVLKRNENWLADAHKRNLSTNAWTVNDEAIDAVAD